MLHIFGATAVWADLEASNIIIRVMPGGTEDKGSVSATEGSVSATISDRVVTLTVTPNSDYKIKKDLIVVEKMVNPSRSSARRRTPGMGTLDVTGSGTTDEERNGWKVGDGSTGFVYTFTVPADYDGAYVTATFVSTQANQITSLSEITDLTADYVLIRDIDASGFNTSLEEFSGTLDGGLHKIYNLSKPLFGTVNGGTVKNLILEDVNISGHTGNTGAIAGTAKGASRIYNCGILDGSVGGTEKTGGLVGFLDGSARVINCYSYATITGGTDVAGIVGYNNFETNANNVQTMVMNCMFYGDITGGTNVSPVYGGKLISNLSNTGLNTFNYYAYEKLKTKAIPNDKYNCALAVKDDYLNRFEFYRLLLNSNKKLAAYYITGNAADANIMAKWVLETADRTIANPKPYPILKAQGYYPSIINYDTRELDNYSEADRNKGLKTGTLSVTISGVGSNAPTGASITAYGSLTLTRTDKDPAHFNFNYDKVQLPYYNEVGTGNYTGNRVVTGWKITAMGPSTEEEDPYKASNYPTTGVTDFPNHNYADRKSRNKDLYSVSGRVFSQGAYFDVPYGVTSITIEPYWGKAAYIADPNYDVTYNSSYGDKKNQLGTQAENKKTNHPDLSGQTVYTNVGDALGSLTGTTNPTVYDYAIVLVGNLHLNGVPSNGDKPFTMMSVDWDNDREPDYSMIYHHSGRQPISPIRFDFINIPGTAQAQKPKDTGTFLNFTIFKTKGWFETTNTCLVYSNQVEYENKDGVTKKDAPLILLGGDFEQFVSTQSKTVDGKTTYIHVGGNVHIQSFGLGTHGDGKESTPHIPVSVTGGEYDGFYLSGTYNQDATVRKDDNAECYISGGHFVEAAGASQEQIDGNVHWQIYDADIDAFYGGGVNAARPITGNITVDIFNSHVGTYCGGPKFGDMKVNKNVKTTAEGCTFTKYFGAGFGGTSYSRKKYYDVQSTSWTSWAEKFTSDKGKYFDGNSTGSSYVSGKDYGKKGIGVATDFDYEFFAWSTGQTGGRFYVNFASFSLASCNNVESDLKNCTINENFYGGGSYGEVKGTAKSVLDGCTVKGHVFGGGYSATLPKVKLRNTPVFTKDPYINKYSGMFEPGVIADFEEYEYDWKRASDYGVTLTNNNSGSDMTNHYLYTNIDLTALGKVGSTDLTVKENCQITGSVYGGGDESAVNQNTLVKIQNKSAGHIDNVYGGGNIANVLGDAEVNLASGTISHDVYGGGRGETTIVGGDVTVNIGSKTKEASSVTYAGTGIVNGDVYGGSALGDVNTNTNATAEKETEVNIYSGTVNGSVFGGGLGQDEEDATKDIAAVNFGKTTVTLENSDNEKINIKTAVFGGANINGVVKGSTLVNIYNGTVGTAPESGSTNIADVVFGGGKGEPTLVEGDVTVNIGRMKTGSETEHVGTSVIHGNVYGGSALGNTNASRPESALVFDATKKTAVNLLKGTINGNVFGGGLGQKNGVNNATSNILSYVGGDVMVLLDGAKINSTFTGEGNNRMPVTGQIFGANNLNGTPKGHVMVHVKRTVDSAKPTDDGTEAHNPIDRDARDAANNYDVAAVYGGGNQADYIPTNATLDPDDDEGNPLKIEKATAEVLIEGCDLTSIEYVYGGGNAAAVPATDVTILGDYIIKYVFGGGNGKSTATFTNPGANIGTYNNGTTSYGTGKASTKLVGAHIMYVFGGSDTKGNVRGGTSITMPDKSLFPSPTYNCCNVRDIKEIYGAGNQAEQDGPVTLVLGCVNNMSHVYGGARMADVKGGVDLVVTSGHFEGVYGGNDESGTIQGPITLTIEETGCDPLEIDKLYLGGNQAAYSVYGYKNTGTAENPVLVARSGMDDGTAVNPPTKPNSESQLYRDPILNIVSCTRIGTESGEDLGGAFGGGYGAGAIMYGNPTVNVNMIPGKFAKQITRTDIYPVNNDVNALGIIRNVYGGGEQANVQGNTTVNICTEPTVTVRSSMGDFVENEPTPVVGALITDNVFGAGKGLTSDVNSALVSGSTTVTMAKGSVAKSVYGGGQLSQVGGNTTITVSGGTIGTSGQGGATYGNIYGGGFGDVTDSKFGLVQGNTNITVQNTVANAEYAAAHENVSEGDIISSPSILHNIYGGGAYGSVGTFTFNSSTHETTCAANTGTTNITITGGTIGTDGHENGMVFGASRGDVGAPNTTHDRLAWVDNTVVVIGTKGQGTTLTTPLIKGSVYGGGENGHTFHDTHVTIHSGMVGITETMTTDPEGKGGALYPYRGNVYGGGCGTDKYDSDSDDILDAYNPLSGIVNGTTHVEINGGHVVRDVYGAGAMGSAVVGTNVTINGGTIGAEGSGGGFVYAAARGEQGEPDLATVGNSNLTISGGTVWMDAYGGGQNGYVKGAVTVNLTGGTVKRDVYGGGALAKTNTEYDATSHPDYSTSVTMSGTGTTIVRNLYGGGLGDLASLNEGDDVSHTDIAADVHGPVKVSVTSGSVANVFGCNNLNGAPKSTVEVEIGAKDGDNLSGSATISGCVYGGGNQAAYTGDPSVKLYGGTVNRDVYGGGLGASAIVTGSTSVTMEGGTVRNDLYGGGSQADVTGSVDVSIAGGTVTHDVYGGGALANTNTGNWEGDGSILYVPLTVKTDPTAEELAAGVLKADATPVAGYFMESAGNYSRITNSEAKAQTGQNYYKKTVNGTWADGKNNPSTGTEYKTIVNLTGGYLGNVYGGGLGSSTTAVNVYGDVYVTINEGVTEADKGVIFNQRIEHPIINGTDYPTPTLGRVFGCNNYNGTPTGEVTVHVYSTRQIEKDTEKEILPGHGSTNRKYQYEIQSVYGGGNQADYLPADGKKSHVIIDGCNETSIEKVYGGGNSAVVPETDVLINGGYDIGYAFGGGNGGRPIKKDNGEWHENEGAIVIGTASVRCVGGKIGQVFGGGDSKGSCGNPTTDVSAEGTGDCPLHITRLYGAGNEGDVASVNIILAACSGNAIEYVHGGSYNAHVHGDVHLTITSGILKNVYGGNDSEGGIEGDIIVDIEETDGCNPIIIQNLVGGGNEAAYPGTKKEGGVETPITHHGKITVNVKSATRIDNVYGGSFNAEADADTEVNINMIKGNKVLNEVDLPKEFSYIPNIKVLSENTSNGTIHCKIDDAIGTIGNVYGGGKQGLVKGNTQVNINSSDKVYIMKRNAQGKVLDTNGNPINVESGKNIPAGIVIDCTDGHNVEGAHITGDVFGGGENADVTGSTEVYICAKKTAEDTYAVITQASDNVLIKNGSVYGGGSAADVKGNATVRMSGGYVFDGVYGGGLMGSVGTFTTTTAVTTESNNVNHSSHAGCIGKPTACATGTGLCTVIVNGGQVGPVEVALEDGGMKNTHRYYKDPNDNTDVGPVDYGFVFGAGRGDVENPAEDADADFRTYVNATEVTIGGTALIMASVYGGGENGRVLGNTHVTIEGGQIGCSDVTGTGTNEDPYVPKVYTEGQWETAINAVSSANPSGIDAAAANFKECKSWDYGKDVNGDGKIDYWPHDPYGSSGEGLTEANTEGSDGHSYYGSVFGGGSGYYPYYNKANGIHEWLRSAGVVYGNTQVDITGGHILTCVYGGNETTDVMGKCTVNMSGGTLGVPRTLADIDKRPVTCYLFGAGKGDQRVHFNTWTNVDEVEVNVTGGMIFGSVFGGGEDGHVLKDINLTVSNDAKIGTWGTSYVDGNIFGGGRGFSGTALTAGSVGGNINVNISGGKMLGSVYGGGRLAATGIGFTSPDDPGYGQLKEDDANGTYGHITINISGGTIGNNLEFVPVPYEKTTEALLSEWKTENHIPKTEFYYGKDDKDHDLYLLRHTKGGNVFGGSMGRLTLLDGSINDFWPKLGIVKSTKVNISGDAEIKGNVYGGGEFSMTRGDTYVTVGGEWNGTEVTPKEGTPIIKRDIFGGGYGSDDYTTETTIHAAGYEHGEYTFTPMQMAGIVCGDSYINIAGGKVEKNIYGGGELATVGLPDYANKVKHGEDDPSATITDFGLSWPYKLGFIPSVENGPVGGTTHINITGGRIGISGKDYMGSTTIADETEKKNRREDNGDVFGAGKGAAGSRYDYAFCANVKATEVTIEYPASNNSAIPETYKDDKTLDCITGSVYGGGENGHVIENTKVILKKGLIGHAIYGGGKGKDTYKHELNRIDGGGTYTADIYSVTAGKVYGNTYVEMQDGYVVRNIYGGGNMASTGKGNYSGGADDYSTSGYGETLTGNLWDNASEFSQAFLSSGKTYVNIKGGQVGYINTTTPDDSMKDGLPYGNVFGGARGASAPNVEESPRYLYAPLFYSGYVNETHVHIYDSVGVDAPKIYGSVYGGGQDGHVRRDTHVIIDAGEIGEPRTGTGAPTALATKGLNDPQWLHRGNVYGSGSGIGKYEYDFNNDKDFNDEITDYGARKITLKETDYSNSAGSVTRFSTVEINGGTIHRNVYGGGSLATVGPPKIPPITDYALRRNDAETGTQGKQSLNLVNISGGFIGSASDYDAGYGGNVYAASRGLGTTETNPTQYSTSVWTEVNILPNKTPENSPVIAGDVYGGGEASQVFMDALVNLKGGDVAHDVYGGGKGVKAGIGTEGGIAADIGRNTTVLLNEGVATTARGCSVERIFGCNNLNGTPKGHALVHVFATQHKGKNTIAKTDKYAKYRKFSDYIDDVDNCRTELTAFATTFGVDISSDMNDLADTDWEDQSGSTEDEKKANLLKKRNRALDNIRNSLAAKYDVMAVYGGGDLAPYEPANENDNTEVIIDGCDLTSIKQVYGSGNAASTSACAVSVFGTYEIDELFGGGNGKDNYQLDDENWYENPGANVGYKNYTHYIRTGETGYDATIHGSGTESDPYKAIENEDAGNKDYRQANYSYGTGVATTDVVGGRIHNVYGGSNLKGNIRTMALSIYETTTECALVIDNSYGAGKDAPIDGEARISLECVDYMAKLFGGSTNSDVNSNVTLTVTNGIFGQVFGGNDTSGKIAGSITVDIMESGCKPIIIDELYGGGYLADYSIYGYYNDGTAQSPVWKPRTRTRFEEERTAALSGVDITNATAVNKALIDAGLYGFPKANPQVNVISATKIGEIYGGGYKATVVGSPHVNVNMENGIIPAKWKNEHPDDFTVGKHNKTATDGTTSHEYQYVVDGSDEGGNAILAIGTIGNVFGGGNEANIIGNTYVEIGTGTHHDIEGNLVDIEPFRNAANITGTVYGGGNLGHVGDFTLNDAGKPISCVEGTGECHVTVSNGSIGPDNMLMTKEGGPDDNGYVFGAGKGTVDLDKVTGDSEEEKLIALGNIAFVDSTEVIINGNAFIKGSVYGGGSDGHVLHNTGVKISGNCQIGNGFVQMDNDGNYLNNPLSMNRPYTDEEWTAGRLIMGDKDRDELKTLVSTTNYTSSLPECSSWEYKQPHAAYDMYANKTGNLEQYSDGTSTSGGRFVASDGHTFYGNVFGGGSGYFPYAPGKWLETVGQVEGDTWVEITGGHILTNIYGGNELTNVLGDTHVSFGGTATLGVPRTLGQIAKHPVTCYLFGGGKGDQRLFFNKMTNVENVHVDINGGTIYGSAFGGGEDGHVKRNVKMTIREAEGSTTKIGTWGTSYVDGNIFGGGRGFSGEAYTAGNVAGSIDLKIQGGTMLGSVYGGGRLASVGYGLYLANETEQTTTHKMYGEMQEDGYSDWYKNESNTYTHNSYSGFNRGRVNIEISGGTIGNTNEFIVPEGDGPESGNAFGSWTDADWTSWKNTNHVPNTEYDITNGRLLHTKGGNVFAGGMGRRTKLNGVAFTESTDGIDWKKLGNVKSTNLTISGDAWIMGNVYGGGEFGAVRPCKDTSSGTVQGGTTTIDIQGGTIGTEITGGTLQKATITVPESGNSDVKYTFGSVFGGGYGTEDEIEEINEHNKVNKLGALVEGNTNISMSAGHVRASIYGGGELAGVEGDTDITISGGEIGRNEVNKSSDNPGYVMFGGMTMGNVYGGGKGDESHTLVGVVKGNTKVTIEDNVADATYAGAHEGVNAGDVISSPKIYHNVYGGGANGSVGTFVFSDGVTSTGDYYYMQTVPKGIPLIWTANTGKATVNIKGGTIGISGRDNGMVDGSSRGGIAKPIPTVLGVSPTGTALKDPYDKMAWVESSEVNIGTENATTGPHIKGTVYGGGENGHVFTHATVNMMSGTIGIVDDTDPWYDFGNTEITQKARGTRGNIYGAGCGTDMYDSDDDGIDDTHNSWAGCVIGNTEVNISGGVVAQNVYGGGSMGSVGRLMEGKNDVVKHEDATDGFALSWPVKFTYQNLHDETSTGKATINITGGRIGTTGSGNGDVFGGTRGEAGDRYAMAQLANVRETEVNINYGSTPTNDNLAISVPAIAGSVYGGSENGHVYEDTHVTLTNGLIGHSVYGGGKGEGQYMGKLIKVGTGPGATPPGATEYTDPMLIYDWLAGKVYGNTHLTIVNGRVLNNVMGGGYMASVGKGNYSGGADDFYTPGYGETIKGNLWTSSFKPELAESETNKKDWAWYFLNSGICYVNVFGGNIGSTSVMEGLPAGNIFGGSHGMPAPSLRESSRHLYNPEWFNGYANETYVTIGGGYKCIQTCKDKNNKEHAVGEMLSLHELQELFKGKTDIVAANGTPNVSYWTLDNVSVPKIWGSVYGGSQDGRIRRDAHVIVNAGDIGLPYTDANRTLLDMENKATSITSLTNEQLSAELDDPQWLHRGNVYGAGSGLSKYKFDVDYDGDYDSNADHGRPTTTYYGNPFKEEDYCQFAGSVIRYTQVDILGGTIHRNVYGGGSVGSVGPPAVPPTRTETAYKPGTTTRDANYGTETIGEGWWSQSRVNIKGIIGTPDGYTTGFKYNPVYGGEVFGACRGDDEIIKTEQDKINFATTVWTMVHIMNGANIMGNVFGGGDAGMVKKDSEVLVGEE